MTQSVAGCPLCHSAGGALLHKGRDWRIVRAEEQGFPAFYRVIWNDHVREFTDLGREQRIACLDAVCELEAALRRHLQPTKVNVASLGNVVPHLHWHVIARFEWDSHFPGPVWASAQREAPAGELDRVVAALPSLEQDLLGKLRPPD